MLGTVFCHCLSAPSTTDFGERRTKYVPSFVHKIPHLPNKPTHNAIPIPTFLFPFPHQPYANSYPSHPTSFPSHTLSLPNCISISPPHSLLPLPPPDLLLPRRPEQLILHLGHLLVLHTDWNASFLFLEDFRDPREDVEELVFCESLIRLMQEEKKSQSKH